MLGGVGMTITAGGGGGGGGGGGSCCKVSEILTMGEAALPSMMM